ncbi:hypothetical protein OK351_07095 [Glutamicibacter sp. MNS18]|uniref:hypothetical protein n=1 Tax=Glutamicibacter sp. MNS18 TaxID=2989817 RepID=UPI002236248E|nr:hypothetical protein [Glutamicibacter sp. MNS18]MCW4465265.1 hypothetical protein [Glutamicibacter sp. MNS18]
MNNSSSAPRPKWPGWLTPVMAAALILAVVWGLGVTVFRGVLENRGLPEEVRGSTQEQFAFWHYGTKLDNWATRAGALAQLAEDEASTQALTALRESLERGAALHGAIRYADDEEPVIPTDYSVEMAIALAQEILEPGDRPTGDPTSDPEAASLLVRTVFEASLDARSLLAAVDPESAPDRVAVPLGEIAGNKDDAGIVTCVLDPGLLNPDSEISEGEDSASIRVARTLDRGYALDYVLQLQAARSSAETAATIEAVRNGLNDQLGEIRTVVDSECADLRLPAYDLPEKSLDALAELAAHLETDFENELLLATTLSSGEAQRVLADALWQNLTIRQDAGRPPQLLSAN